MNRISKYDLNTLVDLLMKEYTGGKNSSARNILSNHYDFNRSEFLKFSKMVCEYYGISNLKSLPREYYFEKNKHLLSDMRLKISKFNKNPKRNFNLLCNNIGTTKIEFNHILNKA